jgi:hypothetical protein
MGEAGREGGGGGEDGREREEGRGVEEIRVTVTDKGGNKYTCLKCRLETYVE